METGGRGIGADYSVTIRKKTWAANFGGPCFFLLELNFQRESSKSGSTGKLENLNTEDTEEKMRKS